MTRTTLQAHLLCSAGIIFILIVDFSKADIDGCPKIVEKELWGARRYKATNYLVTPIPYVIMHQTRSTDCYSFNECAKVIGGIQDSRMDDLHWNDIGDSFMVGGDGNVYEGTGWFMEGAHTHLYNKKSISISFIGYYHNSFRNGTHEITMLREVNDKALKAAHDLIICGKNRGYLRNDVKVIAARQVRPTVNPGDLVFAQIQKWPEWVVEP
ncbi:peptidoglycan-recognition protein 2-like [Copidosoma floridanum]|uniref:peptidoglycan-recognition protein 2-like n=1 Tax=Copidosoma floridanum TaxID=29053 RepID=UPI0006C9414A|nr:peptidoglycan-recognition protein 2-like [Copidosoma floridanum]